MALQHKFVGNIEIAVEVKTGIAVMQVGTRQAAIEEVESTVANL